MTETKIDIVKKTLEYFEVSDGDFVKLVDFNRVLRSVSKESGAKYKVSELDLCLPLVNPYVGVVIKYTTGKCTRYVSNLRFKGIEEGALCQS